MTGPQSLPTHTVGEWAFTSARSYYSPFADVAVDGVFTSPSGNVLTMPAFYDGDGTWKLRFNPAESGKWSLALTSRPPNPDFDQKAQFIAAPHDARGVLKATP